MAALRYIVYIFTFFILLWIIFNPKGIVEYKTQENNNKKIKREIQKLKRQTKSKKVKINYLKNYIKTILDAPELTNTPSLTKEQLEVIEKELIIEGMLPKNQKILRFK